MNESSINLSERAELGQLAEVVRALRQDAPAYEPLLVGAMARDLLDYLKAGAWLLGRDAQELLSGGTEPEKAIQFVSNILAPEIIPEGRLRLAGEMRDATPQDALDLLKSFAAGLAGLDHP